jgi:hypothetical protein
MQVGIMSNGDVLSSPWAGRRGTVRPRIDTAPRRGPLEPMRLDLRLIFSSVRGELRERVKLKTGNYSWTECT